MPFQVYLNWTGDQYNGREILVFADRQCADEFYNRCIEKNAPSTSNPMTDVVRHNPQYWSFSTSPESRPFWFVQSNALDLMPTYMAARINGYDSNVGTRNMPVIPTDSTGMTEYKTGGAYYIRTRAQPYMYWFYDGNLHLSSTKRSKFRIDRDTAKDNSAIDPRRVLERADSVRITALNSGSSREIGAVNDYVSATGTAYDFLFGSFYNGDFGVDWNATATEAPAYITYKTTYAGDVWELVN